MMESACLSLALVNESFQERCTSHRLWGGGCSVNTCCNVDSTGAVFSNCTHGTYHLTGSSPQRMRVDWGPALEQSQLLGCAPATNTRRSAGSPGKSGDFRGWQGPDIQVVNDVWTARPLNLLCECLI